MKKDANRIITPNGALLGERIFVNGCYCMKYKAGKKVDILTLEELVELVSGCKIEKIIFKKE